MISNNLLTGIIGNLELLEHGQATAEQGRGCVRDAAKAAERASALVKQLLNYSRKSSSEQRVIDPNAACESVTRMLSRTIERRIQIRSEYGPNVWPVNADSNQIEQILRNLGVNAADAIQEKHSGQRDSLEESEILLRTANAPQRAYTSSDGRHVVGDFVAISVSDNGAGMTPQIRARIFDAFFTTKTEHRGTGLGLAIVVEFVSSMAGHIDVQSEPGRGTTFTVYLPRAKNESIIAPSAPAAVPALARGGSETVLLVDDESVIVELGREVLEHAGYTVLTAGDGVEAIQLFTENSSQIDLVIMDLCLPKLSGEEAVAAILSDRPDIPIILSSGLPDPASERKTISFGSVAFIQKPYRPSELLTAVREVLDHTQV
ncbi:MAG: response regulator [bacterium]|nr:response regulator [bacterium]